MTDVEIWLAITLCVVILYFVISPLWDHFTYDEPEEFNEME